MKMIYDELNEETKERLKAYFEKRGGFPFYLTCETHECLIIRLLDRLEGLEDECERIEADLTSECDLDREVLFDACLIGMQRAKTEDFDMSVSTLKKELFENIRLGAIWTGNNALLPQRRDGSYEWIIDDRAKEHNKARRYNHPVFKHFDKWRR